MFRSKEKPTNFVENLTIRLEHEGELSLAQFIISCVDRVEFTGVSIHTHTHSPVLNIRGNKCATELKGAHTQERRAMLILLTD